MMTRSRSVQHLVLSGPSIAAAFWSGTRRQQGKAAGQKFLLSAGRNPHGIRL